MAVIHQKDKDEVITIAEEIRQIVAQTTFLHEEDEIKVTLSAGIAQVTSEINERDKLIEEADHKFI